MSEKAVVIETQSPLTLPSLTRQLRACGMDEGQTVLVHMAMSKVGFVIGGAETVILALLQVLGDSGTLMMPTHTTANTDPYKWVNPPVPEKWWQLIRDQTPAFNPRTTPTRNMGVVPELFRTWNGAVRSQHPVGSCAAIGPNAEFLTQDHALEEETGERSPIGRLYELDGYVMLLGVGHGNNTSLHLAEYRASYPGKRRIREGSAMFVDGERKWVNYEALALDADDFGQIGRDFHKSQNIPIQQIGNAEVRFFKQRAVVDFGLQWMEKNRQ